VIREKKGGGEKDGRDSVLVVKIPKETQIQHEPYFLVTIELLDK
jgi:hypothetical protein